MKNMKAAYGKFLLVDVAVVVAVAVLGTARATSAADLRSMGSGQYQDSTLIVPASESVHNLYAVAPQVVVDASSSKDTVAAGGSVQIDGATADDLIVAGGTVEVRGNVGGSARIAGGNVTIDGKVTEDLVVAGGTVIVSPAASVGGDLIVAGGSVVVEGPVSGNVAMAGGSLVLNAKIGGSISAKLTKDLQLGPSADVAGGIAYTAPEQANVDSGAHVAACDVHAASIGEWWKVARVILARTCPKSFGRDLGCVRAVLHV